MGPGGESELSAVADLGPRPVAPKHQDHLAQGRAVDDQRPPSRSRARRRPRSSVRLKNDDNGAIGDRRRRQGRPVRGADRHRQRDQRASRSRPSTRPATRTPRRSPSARARARCRRRSPATAYRFTAKKLPKTGDVHGRRHATRTAAASRARTRCSRSRCPGLEAIVSDESPTEPQRRRPRSRRASRKGALQGSGPRVGPRDDGRLRQLTDRQVLTVR